MQQRSAAAVARQLKSDEPVVILDVREPWELDLARLDQTIDMPMATIPDRVESLRDQLRGRELIVMCHGGVRSARVVHYLEQQGFSDVVNLEGGIQAWSEQVDSSIPTY
ncbi:MAG: rhodanese-like domain-containing protein [Pseudomonadota bacterium]